MQMMEVIFPRNLIPFPPDRFPCTYNTKESGSYPTCVVKLYIRIHKLTPHYHSLTLPPYLPLLQYGPFTSELLFPLVW